MFTRVEQAIVNDDSGLDVLVCPVIWGSDATNLTFTGSKKAHNVFVAPGILRAARRQKMDGMKLAGQVCKCIVVCMQLCKSMLSTGAHPGWQSGGEKISGLHCRPP